MHVNRFQGTALSPASTAPQAPSMPLPPRQIQTPALNQPQPYFGGGVMDKNIKDLSPGEIIKVVAGVLIAVLMGGALVNHPPSEQSQPAQTTKPKKSSQVCFPFEFGGRKYEVGEWVNKNGKKVTLTQEQKFRIWSLIAPYLPEVKDNQKLVVILGGKPENRSGSLVTVPVTENADRAELGVNQITVAASSDVRCKKANAARWTYEPSDNYPKLAYTV